MSSAIIVDLIGFLIGDFPIAAQDKMINEVDLWLMLWMKNRLECILLMLSSLWLESYTCEQHYKRTVPKRVKNGCENEFTRMKYVAAKNGWSMYFMNETYESSLGEIMYTVLMSTEKEEKKKKKTNNHFGPWKCNI